MSAVLDLENNCKFAVSASYEDMNDLVQEETMLNPSLYLEHNKKGVT